MTSRNDINRLVQRVLWQSAFINRDERKLACYETTGVNIAAYMALLMRGDDCELCGGDPDRLLQMRSFDPRVRSYILDAYYGDWKIIAAESFSRLSDDELREIVLTYDGENPEYRTRGLDVTPVAICKLSLAVLSLNDGESVADLGCGRGTFLMKVAQAHSGQKLFGIEVNEAIAALAAIRLDVLGADAHVELGDMLNMSESYRFDKIFANYPFGVRPAFMRGEGEYYDAMRYGREGIGRPASADWLYNKLAFDSLTENGKAVTIMANGAAFNRGDLQARKFFVNNGMIQAVVALPSNLFPGTAIASVLLVLGRNNGPIRMVDASDLSIPGRRWDSMGDDEIDEILSRLENDGACSRLVDYKTLAATDYNLFPQRYLGRSIQLDNATALGDLAVSIERGAAITARELDALTVLEDTGKSFLRLSDIADGCIGSDLPHLRELDPRTERQWLRTGDLIVSKNGAPFKIAVADVPEGQTIIANGNLYIIRLDTQRINPYFAAAFLASEDGKELMERMVVGTTIPNLPLGNLREIQLPVPDMATQEKVAQQYRAHIDEIEVLKIKLEKARTNVTCTYDEVMGR